MTKTKKQPDLKWDTFDFNPGGRPAQLPPKESESKPDSEKQALSETLKGILGDQKH